MKRLTRRQQLCLIEGLCIVWENATKTKLVADKLISNIYRIAHLNLTCSHDHLLWHQEGLRLGEQFKKQGITDIDR